MADPITPRAQARYAELSPIRNTALTRARDNSSLTIPGLVPEDGQDQNASFSQPYQSVGARGVNNLAAWLLVTQLPPDNPFFRLTVHQDTAQELGSGLAKVQEGLARISTKAQLLVESSAARPIIMEVFRHLIVAGNALLHIPLEGTTPRMFRLDQFVVVRDEKGNMIEAVVKEMVLPSTLPEATRTAVGIPYVAGEKEKAVELYTHIERVDDGKNLRTYQEIKGTIVPQSEGTQPYESRGWIALRWQAVPGSDYGRAMISEYYGDLLSLEELNKAMVEFAAVASRVLYIVDPNAMINIEDLASAETGDFVTGYRDRIGTLQLDKAQDFSIANTVAERIEARLSQAFMLRSGMTRDAERVTAEEIRAVAQELENALGGTYTVLSAELQLPYVRRLIYILQKKGEAPDLPESVAPVVTTGFAAMGRSHSVTKIKSFIGDLSAIFGPQVVSQRLNFEDVAMRLGESYGIEALQDIVRAAEEVEQENEAASANSAIAAAAPQIAKGAVDAINQEEQ